MRRIVCDCCEESADLNSEEGRAYERDVLVLGENKDLCPSCLQAYGAAFNLAMDQAWGKLKRERMAMTHEQDRRMSERGEERMEVPS